MSQNKKWQEGPGIDKKRSNFKDTIEIFQILP